MKQFTVIFFALCGILLSGCSKSTPDSLLPRDMIRSYVTSGAWQLVSATQINASGKVISTTYGNTGDSLIFGFGYANGGIILSNIDSYVGGRHTLFAYSLKDTAMPISPAWKTGYGDTLFFVSYSDLAVAFTIKKTGDPAVAYELDSLKKTRYAR